ncbi:dienelactone hydrolase family protein [Paenibacillus sp. N3.4]|uniref:dienelactone hydrolase family protein n=1 Tax=Paenibacillus sp. N3.4 TaxID=2603222 RepID=UPI0011CB2FCE|nr:dienelactone hydrolase family protein [Paenibacillus sp. N3.4]TXK76952.1 dienelactone hydrolase family protein [Paenibacillus sp. N3.4]
MSVGTEWVAYEGGKYSGYAAWPIGTKDALPAVIVIQEIWGVDSHIQDVARRFAQAGYMAFAPDLFARNQSKERGLEEDRVAAAQAFLNTIPSSSWRQAEERAAALATYPESEQIQLTETLEKVFGLQSKLGEFIDQIRLTSQFLRHEFAPTRGQGVASVGFCLGGALSAVLASQDPELRGAIVFYGNPPSSEALASIQAPLLGFYGELDPRITEQIPGFAEQAEAANKSFEYHIYPSAPHAFFNDSRPTYHVSSARDAFARSLGFLNKVL